MCACNVIACSCFVLIHPSCWRAVAIVNSAVQLWPRASTAERHARVAPWRRRVQGSPASALVSKRENENIRRAASHRYAVIPLCMHCYGRRSTKLITVLYGTYIPTQGRQSTDYSVT